MLQPGDAARNESTLTLDFTGGKEPRPNPAETFQKIYLAFFNYDKRLQSVTKGKGRKFDTIHFSEKEFCVVVEPLLSGIVLGLIPVTLAGLFVAAYLQFKRGNQLNL